MTISIGNIKDAEFSEQQKKNSPGYQAATGDLFKSQNFELFSFFTV